jgi:hypothetical protein
MHWIIGAPANYALSQIHRSFELPALPVVTGRDQRACKESRQCDWRDSLHKLMKGGDETKPK